MSNWSWNNRYQDFSDSNTYGSDAYDYEMRKCFEEEDRLREISVEIDRDYFGY